MTKKKKSTGSNVCLGDKMLAGMSYFDKEVYKRDHYKNSKFLSKKDKKAFAKKSVKYFELEAEINKKLGEIYKNK